MVFDPYDGGIIKDNMAAGENVLKRIICLAWFYSDGLHAEETK